MIYGNTKCSVIVQNNIYAGINVNNIYPLENTNYKFDNTGVVIRLPYQEYKGE